MLKKYFDVGFTKKQFNNLIWPDTKFVGNTALWVAFILAFLMASLNLVLDPLALNVVLWFKQ